MKVDNSYRKWITLANITVAVLLIITLLIIRAISVKYECTILFNGEHPYEWGKTPSVAVESVIGDFYQWHALLLMWLSLITWHMYRRNDEKAVGWATYLLCVVIAAAPMVRLFWSAAKYDTTIYDVNEVVVNGNAEPVNLLELTTIPVILSFVILAILIVCAIILHKMRMQKT